MEILMDFEYLQRIEELLTTFRKTQMDSLAMGASAIADCLISDGMIYAFGTGHSHMFALEIFYRAGGLANINPILEEGLMLHTGAVKSTFLERVEGYAAEILKRYPVKKGDIIFIASNSGRNAVSIEMAIEAKKQGLTVIAITSIRHSSAVASRHSSQKRLFELADIVIDNCGEEGDAAVDITGVGKVCPTSSVIGITALHTMISEAIKIAVAKGKTPDIFISANVDGASPNEGYINKYKSRVSSY